MENTKKRDARLDVVRIFALLCVIGVHFFLNSGFYSETVVGKEMHIMCIFRSFFMICVPLFIMLTGYLSSSKELSKKYYKGITRTLVIYLICSIIYSLFAKIHLKQEMNIRIFIENLLSYSGTSYSWYIEMYIGLFLIIPFLNIILNNLKNKKEFKLLLIILFFSIGLPNIINIFKFDSLEWWKEPILSNNYIKILPSWWVSTYPIFYYFLGAYLKKYPIKISTTTNLIILIITVIIDGTFNFYRSNKAVFVGNIWNEYYSASTMLIAFLTFNLLLKIKIKSDNSVRNKILKTLSNACLGGYLLSCIFDNIVYTKLSALIPVIKDRFIYAPIAILLVFLGSIISSIMINFIYNFFIAIIKRIISLKMLFASKPSVDRVIEDEEKIKLEIK